MKLRIAVGILLTTALVAFGAPKKKIVIYAQTVPAVLTVQWNPNPATENIVSYSVSLDGGTPTVVQATSCTPTLCSSTVSVPTFGNHSWSVFASNNDLSGGTGVVGTLQSGPSSSQAFSLNRAPSAPTGSGVHK